MKLISEEIQNAEYLVEEKNGKKSYKIKGIFLQSDLKNRNGRVYPKEVLENEVNRYNREFIQKKRAFGELGHPDGPTVNLERVSHMITKLYPEDRNFIGEAKYRGLDCGVIEENKSIVSSNSETSKPLMSSAELKKEKQAFVVLGQEHYEETKRIKENMAKIFKLV